jgi:hypothetical protein
MLHHQLCRCLMRVKNLVVYYELKSCIFDNDDVLFLSGRSKGPAIYKTHVPKYHYFILKSIKWGECFILS